MRTRWNLHFNGIVEGWESESMGFRNEFVEDGSVLIGPEENS